MRSKMIFGALLVSVALCSQGFGFELLDRVLGRDNGGCGECKACKAAPCEPCAKTCEPCAKTCAKPCVPAVCEKPCGKRCHATPVRDLFDNIKDMFEAKACVVESGCCEKACCDKGCCAKGCCEKACGAKGCCEKACCAKGCCEKACCAPTCEKVCKPKTHKLYRRPLVELLESLFGCDECNNGCCEAACGCGGAAPATTPKTPAKGTEAAPVPAPKADPQASIQGSGIYQASRSLVRN